MKKTVILSALACLLLCGTGVKAQQTAVVKKTLSGLTPAKFTAMVNGKKTQLFTMKNKKGMEVCITNFGGRIVSIMVPDKKGKMRDVVLGFDSVADYVRIPSDFGAAIGRYANRIDQAKMVIDGKEIHLLKNDSQNCLHGGPKGWQYQVYEGKQINAQTIQMTMHSPDGDQNFPGKVTAVVTYKLTNNNAIDITYKATTNKKTVINMTNHSYFNLNGDPNKIITNNILYVNATNYTPINKTLIPTGKIEPVAGTPLDFTKAKEIGKEVTAFDNEQMKYANGYDHNWVLDNNGSDKVVAAKLVSPTSGISLSVYTNEPGIQVYTGNFLNGKVKGKKGIEYKQRAAICLETQHYPDSPNRPEFPSVILEPGKTYYSHCIFKFGVEK